MAVKWRKKHKDSTADVLVSAASFCGRSVFRQIGLIVLVSGFIAFVANTVHPRRIPLSYDWSDRVEGRAREQGIAVIPFASVLRKVESGQVTFIDARSADEFEAGHIPEAVSLPFDELDERFETLADLLDSGRELVLYCSSRDCDDGLMLAEELKAMGVENLFLFVDGFEAWQKHGGAVPPLREEAE